MHELQPVVDFLKSEQLVLATAESCTAGLKNESAISAKLTLRLYPGRGP